MLHMCHLFSISEPQKLMVVSSTSVEITKSRCLVLKEREPLDMSFLCWKCVTVHWQFGSCLGHQFGFGAGLVRLSISDSGYGFEQWECSCGAGAVFCHWSLHAFLVLGISPRAGRSQGHVSVPRRAQIPAADLAQFQAPCGCDSAQEHRHRHSEGWV